MRRGSPPQLQQANASGRDVDELVAYVEEERQLQREERERRREQEGAPIWSGGSGQFSAVTAASERPRRGWLSRELPA